jgi:secreted trypsin-like serine protease
MIALRLILAAMLLSSCHRASVSVPAIVGGDTRDVPGWFASVGYEASRSAYCGGVFIAPRVVLTAAHCLEKNSAPLAVTPHPAANLPAFFQKHIKVERVLTHPDWNPHNYQNDLAILFLAEYNPEDFTTIEFLSLADDLSEPAAGQVVHAMGFGNQSSFGTFSSPHFQAVELPVLETGVCARVEGYSHLTANQFCAGDLENGHIDTCQGDSGGPITRTTDSGTSRLVGIVSWGLGCAHPGKPGIYTRIATFREFIETSLRLSQEATSPFRPETVEFVHRTSCANLQRVSNDTFGEDGRLSHIQTTRVTGTFAPASEATLTPSTPTPSCDLGSLADQLQFSRMVDEAGKTVMVATDLTSRKRFVATTETETALEIRCVSDQGRMLSFNTADLEAAIGSASYKPTPIDALPQGLEEESCSIEDTVLSHFWQVATSGAVRHFVSLRSSSTGGATRFYAVGEDQPEPINRPVLTVVNHAFGLARLTLENTSDTPIFSWKLVCTFAPTLVSEGGVVFPAETLDIEDSEGRPFYQWSFLSTASPWSDIQPSGRLEFTSFAPINATNSDVCRLNGRTLTLRANNES